MRSVLCALSATAALAILPSQSWSADHLVAAGASQGRSYSAAVVTEGGKVVWLAGETTKTDLNGKDISGDPEAQTRTIFALLDQTLKRSGGSLKDIVTMTAFLTDARNGQAYSKVRKELFEKTGFPGSAQITVSALADPAFLIEIEAIAVIGDRCSTANPCLPKP